MEAQQAQEFLAKNRAAFELLGKRMREIDTVKGVNTLMDFKGRQIAIKTIQGWLMEIWNIAYDEIKDEEEEDDIIRLVTKKTVN